MERLTEYHAGVAVIKDKTRQKEAMAKLAEYENTGLTPEEILDGEENLIKDIDFAIAATGISDHYTIGMSNGMKYIKSLIDGKAPIYDEDVSAWIPVEERLPDKNATHYLVTTKRSPRVEMAWYLDGDWFWNNSDSRINEVIAWMPLPELYRLEL